MYIVDVSQRAPEISNKLKNSICKDGYLQPKRARSTLYYQPYKRPTLKLESDTTYSLSYSKLSFIPQPRTSFAKYEKMLTTKPGKIESDTIYKLSYLPSTTKKRKPFIPRTNLSIHGYHDLTTINKTSYLNPGYVRTISFKPYQGKIQQSIPMDCTTIMKESYQYTPVNVKRPRKREFWQTKFKPDYGTTNKLSYQYVEPLKKRIRVFYKPVITAKIERDTIYNMSYQLPGRCITK